MPLHKCSFLICLVAFISLLVTSPSEAAGGEIPWLSGGYDSGSALWLGYPAENGWLIEFTFNPDLPGVSLDWDCNEFLCYGQGNESFYGGSVTGSAWNPNGPGLDFTGVVTGGGVSLQEWIYADGEYHFWEQFGYDFHGRWSNGWYTTGSAYGEYSDDGEGGRFYFSTYSPEPGTLALVGTGVVGMARLLRRRK